MTSRAFIAIALAIPTLSARAQNPVHWTVGATSRSGATITAHLAASIETGWHVYALSQASGGPVAMRITLASGQPFTIGEVTGPTPKSDYDSNFDLTVDEYEGKAAFAIPLHAATSAHAASDSVTLRVRYQACNAQLCLPPRTEAVTAPIR
jgi:thiol:disulfide interchange protein DsbD